MLAKGQFCKQAFQRISVKPVRLTLLYNVRFVFSSLFISSFIYLSIDSWIFTLYFGVYSKTMLFILLLKVLALSLGSSFSWLPYPFDIPTLSCFEPFPIFWPYKMFQALALELAISPKELCFLFVNEVLKFLNRFIVENLGNTERRK